nr:hypothetical protein [Tanacetum cinerariifolium]
MRINPGIKPKEPTYQVVLDALALTTCNPAFLITVEVLVIYMHQFWATINKHNASYRFKVDNKRFFVNVEVFREILNICPKIPGQEFDEPPSEEETLSFIRELGRSREIKYITDVIVDHLHQPWRTFTSIINKCLSGKESDKSISMRNITFMHTAWDDSLLGTMKFVSRHEDTQVYGSLFPKAMTNQAFLDSVTYKTYYAIATGAEPPKPKEIQKKSDSAILSEEISSKKKPAKAKKDVTSTKKPTFKPKSTKRRHHKKDFHISDASGSGDGTNFELGVPDEQQRKISDTNEGIGAKPWVPDLPKYDSESDKESWGDSRDRDENPNLNQSNEEHEEDDEYVNEFTDKEDDADKAKKENEEELDDAE